MKKLNNKIFISFLIVIVTMLIFPLLIFTFMKSLNGLFWFLLLFFAINPIISIIIGVLSGTEIRKLWFVPLIVSIIFPPLYWIVLQDIILQLYIHSLGYLIIGVVSMLVTSFLSNRRKK